MEKINQSSTQSKAYLSIYSADMLNELAPNSAFPASNRSVIPEFQVDNVDEEYERLQEVAVE
jgi:hypothetical protein